MARGLQANSNRMPIYKPEQEAYLSLLRRGDALQRESRQTEGVRAHGPQQALRICAAQVKTHPLQRHCERLITRDPDITRLLDRLQKRVVGAQPGKQDRRVIYGKITAAGLNLLREMDSRSRKFSREILRHVSQTNLKLLIDLLSKSGVGRALLPDQLPFGALYREQTF